MGSLACKDGDCLLRNVQQGGMGHERSTQKSAQRLRGATCPQRNQIMSAPVGQFATKTMTPTWLPEATRLYSALKHLHLIVIATYLKFWEVVLLLFWCHKRGDIFHLHWTQVLRFWNFFCLQISEQPFHRLDLRETERDTNWNKIACQSQDHAAMFTGLPHFIDRQVSSEHSTELHRVRGAWSILYFVTWFAAWDDNKDGSLTCWTSVAKK